MSLKKNHCWHFIYSPSPGSRELPSEQEHRIRFQWPWLYRAGWEIAKERRRKLEHFMSDRSWSKRTLRQTDCFIVWNVSWMLNEWDTGKLCRGIGVLCLRKRNFKNYSWFSLNLYLRMTVVKILLTPFLSSNKFHFFRVNFLGNRLLL